MAPAPLRLVSCAALALALAGSLSAQATVRSNGRPILENQFVTVRDIRLQPGLPLPGAQRHDVALVYLEGDVGRVVFVGAGGGSEALAGGRVVLVELEDRAMASYPNDAGAPPAFPRPGSKRLLENERVTVWDYTFAPDVPSPMHFHDRDVVVVFLGDGALASTTPDGTRTVTEHSNGVTRFHPGNRLHTETLVRGACRVIVLELK